MSTSSWLPFLTLVAGLLGAFLGAYFKEQLSDVFNKRRKRKELLKEIIKNVFMLPHLMKRHLRNKSLIEHTEAQQDILEQYKRLPLEKDALERVDFDIKATFDYIKYLNELHHADYNDIGDSESNVEALIAEVHIYYPKKTAAALQSYLYNRLLRVNTWSNNLKDYNGMQLEEVKQYFKLGYRVDFQKRMKELNELQEELVAKVGEILKP
jgi:hypothetical protein